MVAYYCLVQKVDLFTESMILSCLCKSLTEPILRRDVEAEAVEAVNFLWKRKHFDERGRKRKRKC